MDKKNAGPLLSEPEQPGNVASHAQYRWSTLALLDPFFPSRKMFPNPFLVRVTDSTKESVGGLLDLNMNTRSRMWRGPVVTTNEDAHLANNLSLLRTDEFSLSTVLG
jgi:hypothetical protein